MARTPLALLLLLATPAAAQELVPDQALTLELGADDPVLEGHGPSRTFEYDVTFEGTLYVWASSSDFDPILRVTDSDGELLAQDDDSGGGATACIELAVAHNETRSIMVATADADASGNVVLHLSEAPETTATRAAADDVRRARVQAREAAKAGELSRAREVLAHALDALMGTEEGERSAILAGAAWDLGWAARDASDPKTSERAWRRSFLFRTRTLPDEHPELQSTRLNLAVAVRELGDRDGALALVKKVLEVRTRTLPDDHPDLQNARQNVAVSMKGLGDLDGARALFEKVLEVRTRALPADDSALQQARHNLAVVVKALGDLAAARALQEQVLDVWSRTLPGDHSDLQAARQNFAVTIKEFGDLVGARALEEQVLAARSRELPDDHPTLQGARENLANTYRSLGDLAQARALLEKVLEVRSRTLSNDHPDLQLVRGNLAVTLASAGDLASARALEESVLESRTRTLSDDDPLLQAARGNLAITVRELGDLASARALEEKVLEVRSRTLPDDHYLLRLARRNLVRTLAMMRDHANARRLASDLARGTQAGISSALRVLSSREAELSASASASAISTVLSLDAGAERSGVDLTFTAQGFSLVETARAASLSSARWVRLAGELPGLASLREAARRASDMMARRLVDGTDKDVVADAVRARDKAQREMLDLLQTRSVTAAFGSVPDRDTLAGRVDEATALVGFWRYGRIGFQEDECPETDCLLAHVVRADGSLARVELGPVAPIAEAIEEWRAALGASSDARGMPDILPLGAPTEEALGERVRELVFDPLRGALGDAKRVIVALDDVLHLVPLDALPTEDGVLGDELEIEVRSTLWELLLDEEGPPDSGLLLAMGGVDYDGAAEPSADAEGSANDAAPDGAVEASAPTATRNVRSASGAWSYGPLPHTKDEVDGIETLFKQRFGKEREARVLIGEAASRAELVRLAPSARFLHLATHGYFEPESVPSQADPRPIDAHTGFGTFMSREETLRGLSPMVLCGLALSGANQPRDILGRLDGVITAEEISSLDLSNCELAVLSACDTNVGVRRAGQGVASLQKALHMAGARTVITSLWKVPDEATKELMVDFYRRLWIEGKPKARALWEAKAALRKQTDEHGHPKYATHDWAAWVLTGDPR